MAKSYGPATRRRQTCAVTLRKALSSSWRALWASVVLLPLLSRDAKAFWSPQQLNGVRNEPQLPRRRRATSSSTGISCDATPGPGQHPWEPWEGHRSVAGKSVLSATSPNAAVSFAAPGNAAAAAAAAAALKEPTQRAGFSLFRCTLEDCEEEIVEGGRVTLTRPSATQVVLMWNEPPSCVLLLIKPDDELLPLAAQAIDFLQNEMRCRVLVEPAAMSGVSSALRTLYHTGPDPHPEPEEAVKSAISALGTFGSEDVASLHDRPARAQLGSQATVPASAATTTPAEAGAAAAAAGADARASSSSESGASAAELTPEGLGENIDLVVTLGGDGLLMHSSSLFKRSVPPHLCFNLGSMGFLTPLEYSDMKAELRRVLSGGINVSLRMRLSARIIRDGSPSCVFHALNEVVIDRGSSPYLSNIECYCDDQHLTSVQADGLIIATPTGSTAYSMSAGGSMVHPSVPAILFTPICPHSLSFRPIIFPDSIVLRCVVPDDARAEACVSFDGKLSQPLRRGETLVIRTSPYPVPTICKEDSTADWFCSLDGALGFNLRMRQKRIKELGAAAVAAASASASNGAQGSANDVDLAELQPSMREEEVLEQQPLAMARRHMTIRNDDRFLEP